MLGDLILFEISNLMIEESKYMNTGIVDHLLRVDRTVPMSYLGLQNCL